MDVVLCEPVTEAARGDANGPERLVVRLDRRWERVLHVLEQDLAAGDRLPVVFPWSPLNVTLLVPLPRLTAMT